MRYEGTVYRPPSEAKSLIVQLTIGCARNTCTFCSMYKDKNFRIRELDEVVQDLIAAKQYYRDFEIERIFLADGDALIVKTEDLLYILNKIKEIFPDIKRTAVYGAPKDILLKSLDELKILKSAGMDIVYMGIESGDDSVLSSVKKGVTSSEIVEAGIKIRQAGIKLSATLISGLGGTELLAEHAVNSAKVITAIKPEYLGILTLILEEDAPMRENIKEGKVTILNPFEVLDEMKLFLQNVDSDGTVFRSNHASNYISLAGTFNRDIPYLLQRIDSLKGSHVFKSERMRML